MSMQMEWTAEGALSTGRSAVRAGVCVLLFYIAGHKEIYGIAPAAPPGRGSAAARQRAPLTRMHSKPHQPPTTPTPHVYLAVI
jgi:hypothetical protein